jgi:hypothetical protein
LILISYKKKIGLRNDWNEKNIKHGWYNYKFCKRCVFLSLNFKHHTNYTISVSQYFSNSILVQKVHFCYFLVPGWERKERDHWILAVKRKKISLTSIYATKTDYIWVKMFHLTRRVHIMCFVPLTYLKLKLIFGFRLILVFWAVFWGYR